MFGSHFITNPYKTYNHLHTAAAPLHWAREVRSGDWQVPRYADVWAGLHDPRLSSEYRVCRCWTTSPPGEPT